MTGPAGGSEAALSEKALTTRALTNELEVVLGETADGPLSSPPPEGRTAILDEATGQWRTPPRGNYAPQAIFGEQNAAFAGYRLEDGWVLLEGPSGTKGHPYNSPGFDGVAIRLKGEFELHIIDNKAISATGVRSATALTKNLGSNLEGLERHLLQSRFDHLEGIDNARQAVATARGRLSQGLPLPKDVKLVVTNFGGASTKISQSLSDAGIVFRELTRTQTAPTGQPSSRVLEPSDAPRQVGRVVDVHRGPTVVHRAAPALRTPKAVMGQIVPKVSGSLIQAAGGLFTSWMQDKIRESVENMPPIEINKADIWADDGMRDRSPLDLVGSNLADTVNGFEAQRGRKYLEVIGFWHRLDKSPPDERAVVLAELEDEVYEDQGMLYKAQANIDTALSMESQIAERIADIRDVLATVGSRGGLIVALYFASLSVTDWMKVQDNLRWYQRGLERVLPPIRYLKRRIDAEIAGNERIFEQIKNAHGTDQP